jgi:vacuolar protein sorting-associated protein 45
VNPDTFTLNLGGTLALSRPKTAYTLAEEVNLKRCTSGLLSLLLGLKVKPYVRYVSNSDAAASIAREVAGTIGGERELFTFNRTGGAPLLLIMDRREDPVTPLLSQWTYQAMVHELVPGGIRNNRVDMRHAKGVSKDFEEVVLSPSDDAFYRDHMFANYGDLAADVTAMLDEYSAQKGAVNSGVNSIEGMQRCVAGRAPRQTLRRGAAPWGCALFAQPSAPPLRCARAESPWLPPLPHPRPPHPPQRN